MANLFSKYKSLEHWIRIEDKDVAEKFKNKRLFKLLIDIFDDDIFSSRISYIGNAILILLILISSIEIILNSDSRLVEYAPWFKAIDTITTLIFSLEIMIRVSLAGYNNKKYKKFWGKVRYLTSFYGIIDILSVLPFYIGFVGPDSYHWLKILRIFRIWRIVRYIPAFSSISGAIRRKGDEILVSLCGIILLSLTLSSLIFYAEIGAGSKDFDSIISVFVWSIGKYTGDYGSIANETPLTLLGKFLATLNGLLGIALFALPAGLLGAAFIEQMEEGKKNEKIEHRIKSINKYFDGYAIERQQRNRRYVTFDALQARFLFTDDEIIETIRKSENLRFRAVKSNDNNKYNDIEIIERFDKNVSYGCRLTNKNSVVNIINPLGAHEKGISHFTHTIADQLGYNYLSLERKIITEEDIEIGADYSNFYAEYKVGDAHLNSKMPSEFDDFMKDIEQIGSHHWVFIICSRSNLQGDFVLEYGKEKGTPGFQFENSTINDEITFKKFESELKEKLNSNANFLYSIEHHSIGNCDQEWIGKTINRVKEANVLAIYINSIILTSDDERYNSVLDSVIDTFMETFGNHKTDFPQG
jgi:voltage-gated potassium channel